ncbi:MAG: hypothetical protein WCC63_06645 [Candidatus Bathyarchaeia archaeon]
MKATALRPEMGKLEEIRLKVAKLQMETRELKRMKSDCNHMKRFRKMIVKEKFD